MKKTIIFIICVVIIILSAFYMKYLDYREERNSVKKSNLEYEMYLNKEITGRELTSVVNKAVNNNEKNKVAKNENKIYEKNDETSISIDILMSDNETTYKMETIYNGGMVTFIQYYGDILFKFNKIEYNSKGKVCYMVFEQKTN